MKWPIRGVNNTSSTTALVYGTAGGHDQAMIKIPDALEDMV
jgi:hypothetical protein